MTGFRGAGSRLRARDHRRHQAQCGIVGGQQQQLSVVEVTARAAVGAGWWCAVPRRGVGGTVDGSAVQCEGTAQARGEKSEGTAATTAFFLR